MIVVKLMGGLGNQMFQYAAGRALSVKHAVPLFLDENFLNKDPKGAYVQRSPELHQLKIKANVADRLTLKNFERDGFWDKLFQKKSSAPDVLFEGDGLNSDFFKVGSHVYLNGFWQSESYFGSCRDLLLREFQPNYNLSEIAGEFLEKIKSKNSVSLHVRRGDYVSHAGANKFHGVMGSDYYSKAIDLMQQKAGTCHFFIFSDDINWCKQNFSQLGEVTFVDINGKYSSVDLFLMKVCKHHIIANSSYSWWGSWLCENPDNITVAPATWLLDKNVSTEKLYCKNWIKI